MKENKLKKEYTKINAAIIDRWVSEDWEWGRPLTHGDFLAAKDGKWNVLLTPTKYVPKTWFGQLKGVKILGLASGGGQQMPIFAALGSECVVLDNSPRQIETEILVAKREGYSIETIVGDMTKPLPFADETFDIIFHPVSNCYIEDVHPVFKECFRVLKKAGILLSGLDNGINYIVNDDEIAIANKLPFNPLKDPNLYKKCLDGDWGLQFSHTLEEQIGGQLKAGFILTDIYEDTNGEGRLHELNIPCFLATRCVKKG